jgi:hypothetical protein
MNQFGDHTPGKFTKRQDVVHRPCAFFDCPNVALHFRNMLAASNRVQCYAEAGEISTQDIKLSIHEDGLEDETSFQVEITY